MLNRKLLEVLSRFGPVEQKQLRLFLQSPYFTQGSNSPVLLELYDHIMSQQADENHPSLSKEFVFRLFFPNRNFQEKEKNLLDSLTSELFRLVKKFLTQEQFDQEKNSVSELLPLMRFYRRYGLEERFWQTANSARKIQNAENLQDTQYFLSRFKIEEEISNFQGMFNTHEDDANINNSNLYLDTFFSIVKLEQSCALRHRQKLSQVLSLHPPILTEAIVFLVTNKYLDSPLAQIYTTILHLIEHPKDEEKLKDLEVLIWKHKSSISPDKFRDLTSYYRAFWGWQYLKSGSVFYRQKLFEIYSDHLNQGYFYIDHKLTPAALRVLTNSGLKVGEFDWVKKLLEDHPPERICGTKFPVEAHSLNLAEYYFHKKEYAEAEAKLTYRAFENPNFSISADVLLIKIYYDTGSELLDSRMKALEQKIRRTKISAETKAGYYNFLKKLDKVIKYGWQKNSPRRAKLIEDVRTTPSVFAREWLLEKMETGAR